MTLMVPVALLGWIPVVLGLFAWLRPHRAAIAGFLLAWMLLPIYNYEFPGFPDYNKVTAACLGILLGGCCFDLNSFRQFRFRWVDFPVIGLCITPFFTSLSNELGAYDGLSAMLYKTASWGVPWFIGRVYLYSPERLRDMVMGIFLGGLFYIPFCVYELRMSPVLHRIVYGFGQHDFGQTIRGDGYRPMVFMEHGLMVAMWMAGASLCGVVMAGGGFFKHRFPERNQLLLGALGLLLLITVLCRSAGATILLLFASGIFLSVRLLRARWPLLLLIVLPVLYMTARGTGYWDGQSLVDVSERTAGEQRADSLAYRMNMENMLIERALERPWLGWGRWHRSFVRDDRGELISVPDGLWILAFGQEGLVGLLFLTLALSLPILLFIRRFPPDAWAHPDIAILTSLPILLGVFMIDNLFNNMFNPAFLLAAGGMAGFYVAGTGCPASGPHAPRSSADEPPETRTRLL